LLKPGKLTPEEFEVMKSHCEIGYRILSESTSEILSVGAEIALNHHEKYNGQGYPRGLVGNTIPLTGRIGAICDVFDALTTERPYKGASSPEEARVIMMEGKGNHFDPEIFDHFNGNFHLFAAIRSRFSDK